MLHDKYTVADAASRIAIWEYQALSYHPIRDFFDLLDWIADMNAFLKAILQKDALCAGKSLDLRFYDKFALEIWAELTANDECLLAGESNSSKRDRDHVFVNQLGSLILVQVDMTLGQLN